MADLNATESRSDSSSRRLIVGRTIDADTAERIECVIEELANIDSQLGVLSAALARDRSTVGDDLRAVVAEMRGRLLMQMNELETLPAMGEEQIERAAVCS